MEPFSIVDLNLKDNDTLSIKFLTPEATAAGVKKIQETATK